MAHIWGNGCEPFYRPRQQRTPRLSSSPRASQAIKAALNAGLKLTQVARHFGLSPADVRKVSYIIQNVLDGGRDEVAVRESAIGALTGMKRRA